MLNKANTKMIHENLLSPQLLSEQDLGAATLRAVELHEEQAIVDRFEQQGFVKEAPQFTDQVADTNRTNNFEYIPDVASTAGRDPWIDEPTESMSEHEGLQSLDDFLKKQAAEPLWSAAAPFAESEDLSKVAAELRHKLTFIGEKEYAEGVDGLHTLWKSYLDANPDLQIYLPAEISAYEKQRKSDAYLIDRVMRTFTPEEHDAYQGRIVTDLSQLTASPENTKIILAEDWTMSGQQLAKSAYGVLHQLGERYRPSIEIDLIAASEDRLREGLITGYDQVTGKDETLPVKAYFKARTVQLESQFFQDNNAPITGTHSSGDYGFELPIEAMVQAQQAQGKEVAMPPLTNVVRTYRNSERQPRPVDDTDDFDFYEEDLY